MKQRMACLLIGILMGAVLLGGNVSQAAEAFLKAFPSTHTLDCRNHKLLRNSADKYSPFFRLPNR